MSSELSYTPDRDPALFAWVRRDIRTMQEMGHVIDIVVETMKATGYPKNDLFCVRMGMEEAIVNAIKHGHRSDPAKCARVEYLVNPDFVVVEVEDEGPGFDLQRIADPGAPENLQRTSGRGVVLIRSCVTSARYNPRGNCVTLYQSRSAA